jgi:hypothetical protein
VRQRFNRRVDSRSASLGAPDPDHWAVEPWRSLGFRMLDPHRFQYRYESDGHTVRVSARADLGCNGRTSYHHLRGKLTGGRPEFEPLDESGAAR